MQVRLIFSLTILYYSEEAQSIFANRQYCLWRAFCLHQLGLSGEKCLKCSVRTKEALQFRNQWFLLSGISKPQNILLAPKLDVVYTLQASKSWRLLESAEQGSAHHEKPHKLKPLLNVQPSTAGHWFLVTVSRQCRKKALS